MAKKQISTYKFIPGVIPPAYDQYPKAIALLVANQTFLINEMDQYIRNQIAANINTPASPWYGYTLTIAHDQQNVNAIHNMF